MGILRKITRILIKTLKYACVMLILLLIAVAIGINTYTFQTWLGRQASSFLSDQLGTRVSVGKVNLDLISAARLQDVYVEDQNHDTLFYGGMISAKVSGFDYKRHRLNIDEVKLSDTKAHLIQHKGSSDLNFQFLIDYFESADTTTKSGAPKWAINYGTLKLDNVDFIYRNEQKDVAVSSTINYNNIHASHIYGDFGRLYIINDSVYADVKGLKCVEQSGLTLEGLTARVKVSPRTLVCKDLRLQTKNSLIRGELAFRYKAWGDYSDFINKVTIDAHLQDSTRLGSADLAYFVKELAGLDKTIGLSGSVSGPVADLHGKGLKILYGKSTVFRGDLVMTGLPNIDATYMHVDVKYLSSTKQDIETIPLYPFTDRKLISLPRNFGQFGVMSYKGQFDGFVNDFTSYGHFSSDLGAVSTDLAIKVDTVSDKVSYQGHISTGGFVIGKLLGVPGLGSVALDSRVKGRGLMMKDMNATLDGKVNAITYNGYTYQDIAVNGEIKNKIFKGDLVSKDKNADFDFDGKIDFTGKVPAMDFISTVNKVNLKRLGFLKTDINGELSSQILINLKGDNIDNMSGMINFDNTIYKTDEKTFKISTFELDLDQETADKQIKLASNLLDFTANGRFRLSSLPPALGQFLHAYYPTFITGPKTKTVYTDAFNYKLTIKKFNTIRDLFVHDLMISPGAVFEGNFDAQKNLFNLNSKSDSIRFKTVKFSDNRIESYSQNNKINLVFKSAVINLTDSIRIQNYFMYVVSKDKFTKYNLEWDNKRSPKNAGRFAGNMTFDQASVVLNYDQLFITTNDSTWVMKTAGQTIVDSSGKLTVNPLLFTRNNQLVSAQGALSNSPGDKLSFELNGFDLEQLAPLLGNKLKLDGTVSGNLSLHNSVKNLAFSSDLKFAGLKLNNNDLGEGELKTEYSMANKYIYIDGFTSLGFVNAAAGETLKNISFSGYYYTDRKEESLDISFEARPASLKLLNPYLAGILTLDNALITGEGMVTGTPDKPAIHGKFNLTRCDFKVDYTNVNYSLTGPVELLPDQIRFEDLQLKENPAKNNAVAGTVSGNIFHNNFKDMRIDFDVNFKNMLVLNTPPKEGEAFYGKAFASGRLGIYGLLDNVTLDVDVKTEKGTIFNLPLDGPAEVSDNNFIRFVRKDTLKVKEEEKHSGFSLDMHLIATPDAEAQIIFDAKNGDVIRARGDGDLTLKLNNFGKFDMFGEYVIASGDYLFTLENFITKKFELQKGSALKWSGNPVNAEIDITATYKQRASIAPLFPLDTTGIYKRRYPVDCQLFMKDKLMSPDISFGIELRSIDEGTYSKIKAMMLDEAELNRQVFSLLLLKSFVTPLQYSSAGGISAGNAIAANGSEMLSNRLSGFLNTLTNQVDIGVNYRPGGQLSSDELDIALSKQLLNNRLSVDGNLGVNNGQNNTATGGLIGDVNVEYKLTDDGRYRIKGFNRSNDNTQMATTGGPFTQGVGVFYREEFESWNDLYRRYINKLKPGRKKQEPKPEATEQKKIEISHDPNQN